ncbi:MAG: hypothetical protein RLY69_326 [Verrucomicrobiota bacterium]
MLGFRIENVDIEPHFHAGSNLSDSRFETESGADITRIVGNGIKPVSFCDVNRALVLKALTDEEDGVEPKNFFGANDRIESAQACIIADDVL